MIRRLLTAALALGLAAPAASSAATEITVANQGDGGPGSLRQAIADVDPGGTVVVPAGAYVLSSGELAIAKTLTISGAGAASTVIDAQATSRVFHTSGAGNQITISGVTIRGGNVVLARGASFARGGGVLNEQATLTLSNDVVTGNQVLADGLGRDGGGGEADGGGVFNAAGILNLVGSDIKANSVSADGNGGQGGGAATGGGLESTGPLTIQDSTFEDNVARARGGQDLANRNQQGGTAEGGGLLASQLGSTTISGSTFRDNVADSSSGPGATGGSANGGGAQLDNGSGTIAETNVTFVGNIARATGGFTSGGGISLIGDSAGQLLTNATLASNSAVAGATNQGGNLAVGLDDSAAIANTVISGGVADPGFENCVAVGTLLSHGHNLESRDQCNLHAPGDIVRKDPLFGTFQDNGGPVETVALQPGSPAIDAGAADVCPSFDARGVLRPAGGGCDIGAFEIATPSAATGRASGVTAGSALLGATVSNPDLAAGSASFEYGTSTSYGASTAAQPIRPTTTGLLVTAPVAGLSPNTTYHFRVVIRNATGTVVGDDQAFSTTAAPSGPHPLRFTLQRLSIAGATASLQIACDGGVGQRCSGTVLGTTRVHRRGSSITSISRNARSKHRGRTTTNTVTVTRGTFSIAVGRKATVRLTANAAGRKLLARFHRLPIELVISGPGRLTRTITLVSRPR